MIEALRFEKVLISDARACAGQSIDSGILGPYEFLRLGWLKFRHQGIECSGKRREEFASQGAALSKMDDIAKVLLDRRTIVPRIMGVDELGVVVDRVVGEAEVITRMSAVCKAPPSLGDRTSPRTNPKRLDDTLSRHVIESRVSSEVGLRGSQRRESKDQEGSLSWKVVVLGSSEYPGRSMNSEVGLRGFLWDPGDGGTESNIGWLQIMSMSVVRKAPPSLSNWIGARRNRRRLENDSGQHGGVLETSVLYSGCELERSGTDVPALSSSKGPPPVILKLGRIAEIDRWIQTAPKGKQLERTSRVPPVRNDRDPMPSTSPSMHLRVRKKSGENQNSFRKSKVRLETEDDRVARSKLEYALNIGECEIVEDSEYQGSIFEPSEAAKSDDPLMEVETKHEKDLPANGGGPCVEIEVDESVPSGGTQVVERYGPDSLVSPDGGDLAESNVRSRPITSMSAVRRTPLDLSEQAGWVQGVGVDVVKSEENPKNVKSSTVRSTVVDSLKQIDERENKPRSERQSENLLISEVGHRVGRAFEEGAVGTPYDQHESIPYQEHECVPVIHHSNGSSDMTLTYVGGITREKNMVTAHTDMSAVSVKAHTDKWSADVEKKERESRLKQWRSVVRNPKYRRGFIWNADVEASTPSVTSTLFHRPLSDVPIGDYEHTLVTETIVRNADLFKIVTPIRSNILSQLTKSHLNRPFVESVLKGF